MSERAAVVIDPVCGMRVVVADAEAEGLTAEHLGRTYAFCRAACRDAFVAEPHRYAAHAEEASHVAEEHHATAQASTLPIIDEGIRRWYENCSCCLSDTYPEIKAQLDAERAASAQPPVAAGICEVAEAGESAPTR